MNQPQAPTVSERLQILKMLALTRAINVVIDENRPRIIALAQAELEKHGHQFTDSEVEEALKAAGKVRSV